MDIKTQLSVLNDILDKKVAALREILSITENESAIIGESTAAPLLREMYAEKQKRIDNIVSLDDLFKDIYNKIKPYLTDNDEPNKHSIVRLQNNIRIVTDLYVSIKVLEDRNAQSSSQKKKQTKKMQTTSSNSAVSAYKRNKR